MKRTLLALMMLAVAAPAWAQFDTASVVGTVRDASGAVIPGATVTLTNTATGVSATRTSNARGLYEFITVRPGTYVVTGELSGFAVALADNVLVQVGARMRVDLTLTVGQLSEKVEVTGFSPLIETDSSQRSQVISGDQMRELALNGREYSSLALLSTGVRQSALNKSTNSTPREGAFNVNGLRSTFNNFMIDGLDNNAYGTSNQGFSNQVMQPPPDAVGEFRVVTNNQSAEYGRAAGATVNVVYRSGTNQFHVDAWEFFRDTALNATTYFKPPDGRKPPLRRNQFGGVVGGPLIKNRAFFFADYEGFRQDTRGTVFSTLPSATQKQGVLPVDVVDPRTGATYAAGTRIPMTSFAQKVLSGLPDPNLPGAANNFSTLQLFTNDSNKAGGKVDLTVSPALSVFGRYGWRKLDTFDEPTIPLPSGGGGNGNIYARSKQFAFGATYILGPQSLLEVRFGWSNTEAGKNPPALGTPADFGIPGLPTDPRIAGGMPSQTITGYSGLGRQATNPQWQFPTVYNPKVNYTWLMGRQSLKAGYEFQHVNVEVQDVNPLYGLDTYTGQFSRPAGATVNNLYNLADFMLGLRSQYALTTFFIGEMRQNLHFVYLQDDIRVNDKLTVNAGLRYEYATPFWEANNALTNFDPVNNRMITAKDGSMAERALVNPDKNNFGPRLGLAYTVAPKTVIRGGWGVSFVHMNRIGSANLLSINGPQVVRAVIAQGTATAPTFRPTEQGYPTGLTDPAAFNPLTANVSFIPQDYRSSPVHSWYASVQREFGPNMLLDVAYVGNKADDQLLLANFNQAAPNNPTANIPLQLRRPIPNFADITYVFNGGKSRYKALQVKYEWRLPSEITLLNSLTLSEAKDNGAGALENQNGNFPAPQDLNNLDADFGLSGYHQPYNITTSFIWGVPFGHGKRWGSNINKALDLIAGGWQISGVNMITAGERVTLVYSPAPAFQVSSITNDFWGANNYRPNLTCDPALPGDQRTITNYFNASCVAVPTDQSKPFGDAPRNSVSAPNFWQFDLAALKQVRLGTQARVELRVEAFNLFNRVNFTPPASNRSVSTFGTITGTYPARQVQLGVKFLW
jgi:Carboxypeptidase regulatory-like domain/TonB dependent receptor-like, beta-barrel/TonB-dependent Receptor Plug Domain